ncbi:hypothetical protein L227DRAFT_469065, partial [Lentinus tigrinus ALCF2SS1-6]
IFEPRDGTSFLDNCLTEAEADLLCGICKVYTSNHNQTEDLSWWPKASTWCNSGMNTGIWNPWNEGWFSKRLQLIREGKARPLRPGTW